MPKRWIRRNIKRRRRASSRDDDAAATPASGSVSSEALTEALEAAVPAEAKKDQYIDRIVALAPLVGKDR